MIILGVSSASHYADSVVLLLLSIAFTLSDCAFKELVLPPHLALWLSGICVWALLEVLETPSTLPLKVSVSDYPLSFQSGDFQATLYSGEWCLLSYSAVCCSGDLSTITSQQQPLWLSECVQ